MNITNIEILKLFKIRWDKSSKAYFVFSGGLIFWNYQWSDESIERVWKRLEKEGYVKFPT